MRTVKVSRKHQIAVPAEVRRQLNIRAGDRLGIEVEGDKIVLHHKRENALEELIGLAPEIWHGVDASAYINGLRDEWSSRER